jgi:hypothetical protein
MIVKSAQTARRGKSVRRIAKGPCEMAYLDAQATFGTLRSEVTAEKLRQISLEIDAFEVTLLAIVEVLQGRQSQPVGMLLAGGCCTTDDKGIWLKNLPKILAWCLGRIALPTSSSRAAEANFHEQITRLLTDCEFAYAIVKPSVEIEYRVMRAGESSMLPLILRTRAIFGFAIAECQMP